MELKKYHYIAIIFGIFVFIFDLILFYGKSMFFFIIGISTLIIIFPFFFDFIFKTTKEKEKSEMFLEFLSDLVESVKTGSPIAKAIINVSKRDYKALNPYIKKLASQIALGIPLEKALETFAKDTKNKVIGRAIELISEAEKAGGKIESILEAALKSVEEIEEINRKRRAAIHSMVMQGYLIFFIFLVIMVIIQLKFIPMMLETLGGLRGVNFETGLALGKPLSINLLNNLIFIIILLQSFFTGLVIGKLSEGRIKIGLKHSFILMAIAFFILQGAKLFS